MKKFSQEESYKFRERISFAVDAAEQAIDIISFCSSPEINKDIIQKIKAACNILEDIMDKNIYKP